MDFQSAMETFAEAWVAANTQTPLTEAAAAEAQALAFSRSAESMSTTSHELMADKDSEHEYDVVRSTSLRSPHTEAHLAKVRTPSVTGKSIPVHCIVEQVPSPQNCDQSGEPLQPTVELDSYAIVPSSTLFNELVRTGLVKLGYTQSETIGAKGAIHIKNWKPLSFDMITDDPEATVGEILGELTTVATLRIRLYSIGEASSDWNDASVRCAVIGLLKDTSQSNLSSICPLSQPMISSIANSKYHAKIGKDKCKEFGEWYSKYRLSENAQTTESPAKSTETRLTFHPSKEVPLLRNWFQHNRNATDTTLKGYVHLLNKASVRQERTKVTLQHLKNWWKNERQRERKSKQDKDTPKTSKKASATVTSLPSTTTQEPS